VLVSADLPAAKPDSRTFRAAGDALAGLSPILPIMVGDRVEHDVEPAVTVGWNAIWLDRKDRGATLPTGAARVHGLRELADHPLLKPP
jgi:FMN phosphatase YigB (HAD superfamily)